VGVEGVDEIGDGGVRGEWAWWGSLSSTESPLTSDRVDENIRSPKDNGYGAFFW
jgi:hypothetical protein